MSKAVTKKELAPKKIVSITETKETEKATDREVRQEIANWLEEELEIIRWEEQVFIQRNLLHFSRSFLALLLQICYLVNFVITHNVQKVKKASESHKLDAFDRCVANCSQNMHSMNEVILLCIVTLRR